MSVRPNLDSAAPAAASGSRLASIDLIRGAVMVLMAIDHVRVYSGLPAGGPTPGIFFTRWITHFCAPAFVFLAGTSVFFYGRRHADLSRFLFTRGAWLVLLELTVLRVAWTFNFDFAHYEMAGVIWVIGWCMILMAGLVRLPVRVVGVIGIAIIALAQCDRTGASSRRARMAAWGGSWKILYVGFFNGPIQLGADGPSLIVLYSIIPWIGVMAAGYAFGTVLALEPAQRNRLCLQIGLGAIALFLVLRGFNLYGDPRPWERQGRTERPTSDAGAARVPQYHQVSGVAAVPADDAGSHDRPDPRAGNRARPRWPSGSPCSAECRSSSTAPHPADSRARARRVPDRARAR